MLHENYSDQELVLIAKESISIIDFCRRLGYKSATSYHKNVKSRLDSLGVAIKSKSSLYKHSDAEVLRATIGAKSVTGVMRKLGLNYNGYAHNRFAERLRSIGFDVDSLPGAAWNSGQSFGPSRNVLEYLVKDGLFITSSKLRKRIIAEGLKENRCNNCGRLPQWNGKELTLQLDHINGIRSDNRLENLRILCPNCHSQTNTHSRIKTVKQPR